jgi:2-dehydro-3-deoxygluconokinase
VLYDRAFSAISRIRQKDINWKRLLEGTRIFHTTGITAALSKSAAQVALRGMQTAKSLGITTSLDLNYRAKLWSEADAERVMSLFMPYTDILFTTEEDTYRVFKIKGKDYAAVARKLHQRFKFKIVAITLRETPSVWHNRWTAIAFARGRIYEDITYDLEIVDRVGSGDAFTAGFLFGLLTFENDIQRSLQFGNALAALKHSIPGDLSWVTRAEVERLLASPRSLRISR